MGPGRAVTLNVPVTDKYQLVSVWPNSTVLGGTELTPLGDGGGAVGLEILSVGEDAFLIEKVKN